MTINPSWSDKIDERGMPVDPLNSNSSRNRVTNLFAHGTITSITLRMRYLSIFCWSINQLPEDVENRYDRLKNIEKIFGLASRYRQLQQDQSGEALRGMDGNSRFSYNDEEFDQINLDKLKLLKNDQYAYSQFYENQLQNYLLKRGEFELTDAGAELAEIVDVEIGTERDRILECARDGEIQRTDIEAIAPSFANQSLYLEPECVEERNALQKILLGFVDWDGDTQTGTVKLAEDIPTEISFDVLEHLKSTIESGKLEEAGSSKLYQKYHRGHHHYRAAHSCFLCRCWQLQSETNKSRLALSDSDKRQFRQYRDLMRLYWLQVYAGYAIEAQLEALCLYLNSRIPPRADYEPLLNQVADNSAIQKEITNLTQGFETTEGADNASSSSIVRNLTLYGVSDRTIPNVSVNSNNEIEITTLGETGEAMDTMIADGWESTPAVSQVSTLNEVLLARSIRSSLNAMREAVDDETKQLKYWTESLARSIALLCLTVSRFKQIKNDREWLYNYAYNRFDSPYISISELTRFVDRTEDTTSLGEFGRAVISEKVVETHLQVFYSRLSPGNLKRALSFDQDNRLCLEVDKERGSRPYASWVSLVRFDELNTLLRDAGLLSETESGYEPTEASLDILSRITEVDAE